MKKFRFFAISVCLLGALVADGQNIAILADIHVSPDNEASRQLRLAVEEINAGNYDLVVMDGDLTNEGADHELTYVKDILDQINHPLYVIPGNHEDTWSQSATKTFVDLWGNDRFVTSLGDIDIVGINCGPYMKMGDGHIKQEDLHWLKHTLDSVSAPGRMVISFNHYPIRKDDLDNYIDYGRLLEQYPVITHINGHYHQWDKYMAGDIDAVTVRALKVDDTYGYTILTIDDGKCIFKEKIIGETEPTTKYEFEIRTQHEPTFSDAISTDIYVPGFDIDCIWADTASIFTRLAMDADNVYFGTSLGEAKAVNKAERKEAWSESLGASLFSRPLVTTDGEVAYPYSEGIRMIDTATGTSLGDLEYSKGPYVADGIVNGQQYIQGGYKKISCYDAADGKLIWHYDSIDNYCQASPTVAGDDLVFGAWDTYLRCIDRNDGSLKWKWSNGRPNNLFSPGNVVPVVTDTKVIIVAPDRYMTAIDRSTGETLWRDNSHKFRESLGHSSDNTAVYAKTMDGELVAVDATSDTYNELWVCDMGLGYEHAPCIVAEQDGVIYAGSRRGLLTAVSADTHQVLWQVPLGSSETNGIDIDPTDGSVWVSLIEGRIWRIARR